jgi:enoyl-CoA hydratase/carnithine racemase
MNDTVRTEIDSHVAIVTLNRASKKNAINQEMFEALAETGDKLAKDPSVRAVVLHGAGDVFCAGIDTTVFQGGGLSEITSGLMAPRGGSLANTFQTAAYVWRELPVPVIAAIKGVAFGGGLQIALGADIRYATADAQFSIMEIKWGIIPDMAISTTLRHVMPVDRIKELAWTGRVLNGVEALESGLISAIKDDPYLAALELAGEIAAKSPDAIRAIKRLVNESWQNTEAESLRLEAKLQMSVIGSTNQVEAVMANMQGRAAEFSDPEQ